MVFVTPTTGFAATSAVFGSSMATQFVIARATHKRTKYYPRHFRALANHFGGVEWHDSLATTAPGNCTIVVRSPGYRGLGREMAREIAIECSFDLLTDEELELVRHKRGRILVDLGWEMLDPTPSVVASLASTLQDLGIEPTRVFIFHNNQSARLQFNRCWSEVAGTQPPFTIEYPVSVALCVIYQQRQRDDAAIARGAERSSQRTREGTRSRLFTSFNGEVRPHRLYVAAALETLGLLERGYFSLIYPRKSLKETEEEFRRRSLNVLEKLPRGKEFVEAGLRILDKLPMELDLAEIPPGGIEEIAWLSQDPRFYDDSHFTIVIDTAVSDSKCLFVTEKVLKPIMNRSPFLLIGSPAGADLLRSYGFRTFEPLLRQCEWGTLEDVLSSGIDEVVRLSRLSGPEIQSFSRQLASTCDYNAAHFWNVFPDILKHKFHAGLLTLGPPR